MTTGETFGFSDVQLREMAGAGAMGFAEERGGISQMLEERDEEGLSLIADTLLPHVTEADIAMATRVNKAAKRIAEETGVSFEEAQIKLFKSLEAISKFGKEGGR